MTPTEEDEEITPQERQKKLEEVKQYVVEIKEIELLNWDPLTEEITIKMIEDETERETAETIKRKCAICCFISEFPF